MLASTQSFIICFYFIIYKDAQIPHFWLCIFQSKDSLFRFIWKITLNLYSFACVDMR